MWKGRNLGETDSVVEDDLGAHARRREQIRAHAIMRTEEKKCDQEIFRRQNKEVTLMIRIGRKAITDLGLYGEDRVETLSDRFMLHLWSG